MTQVDYSHSENVVQLHPARAEESARQRHLRLMVLLQREHAWFDALVNAAGPEEEAFAQRAHFAICQEIEQFTAAVQRQPATDWPDIVCRAHLCKHKEPIDPADLCPDFQRAARDLVEAIIRVSGGRHA